MSWGYRTDNGPDTWVNNFPNAAGEKQSPIDIVPKSAVYDEALHTAGMKITYYVEQNMKLDNTGASVKANVLEPSVISGGPLKDTYQLEQFHFHWGSCKEKGSEHTLDGKMTSGELHLVHWNRDKYKSFAEAVDKEDGLAVLGVLLQEGKEHSNLKLITDCLDNVKFQSKQGEIKGQFNPQWLLPKNTSDFWTYPGSLTTPPCYESVTWIVFKEQVEVSEGQFKAMRTMCCGDCDGDHIEDNYRPPLALNARKLRASFK